jgi:hypothetical protein
MCPADAGVVMHFPVQKVLTQSLIVARLRSGTRSIVWGHTFMAPSLYVQNLCGVLDSYVFNQQQSYRVYSKQVLAS